MKTPAAPWDSPRCRWHAFSDGPALQQAAVAAIIGGAAQAIRERSHFHLVLAGGNTPRGIYRAMCAARTDWSAWHTYFFGDERCLPPGDPARNSPMAAQAWLDSVPIPPSPVYVIAGELGALQAARMYAETLQAVGDFDLVLLGLGEDGHTARLFPGHEWGTARGAADTSGAICATVTTRRPELR